MNAPLDHADVQVATLSSESALETAPALDNKICWVEVHQGPYLPDQQVELLHLQAEAEALLLQLQARHQRRQRTSPSAV